MRAAASVAIFSAATTLACQSADTASGPFPVVDTCSGIRLELVEQAVAPPANVSARLRASGCDGQALSPPLDLADFEIVEDGKLTSTFEARREVRSAKRDGVAYTLLALDLSGSVVRSGLRPAMVAGARKLVRALTPDHHLAVYGFDGRPDLIPYAFFTTDAQALERSLERLENDPIVDDSTNLYGAVLNGLGVLDSAVAAEGRDPRLIARGALVVFTDGSDRAARVPASRVENAVATTPHATLAIGVGGEIDPEALSLVGQTARAVAADQAAISDAFEGVAADLRARALQDFIIDYCSPARAGSHVLEIHASREGVSGEVKIDFNADGFGAGCDPAASPLH